MGMEWCAYFIHRSESGPMVSCPSCKEMTLCRISNTIVHIDNINERQFLYYWCYNCGHETRLDVDDPSNIGC